MNPQLLQNPLTQFLIAKLLPEGLASIGSMVMGKSAIPPALVGPLKIIGQIKGNPDLYYALEEVLQNAAKGANTDLTSMIGPLSLGARFMGLAADTDVPETPLANILVNFANREERGTEEYEFFCSHCGEVVDHEAVLTTLGIK